MLQTDLSVALSSNNPQTLQSFIAKHRSKLEPDKLRNLQNRLRALQRNQVATTHVARRPLVTTRSPNPNMNPALAEMMRTFYTQQIQSYLGSRKYKDLYSEAGLPSNWPKPIPFCSLAAAGRKYGYVKASVAPAVVTIPAATSILIHPSWYQADYGITWRTLTGAGSGDVMTPSHVAASTDLADAAVSGGSPWRFLSPFQLMTDSNAWSGFYRQSTGVAVGDVSQNVPNKYQLQGGWMSVQPILAYDQTGAIRISSEQTCPRTIGRNAQEYHHRPQNQQSTMHNDMHVSFRVPMSAVGAPLTYGEFVEDVAPMEGLSGAGGEIAPFYIPSSAHEDWVYPSFVSNVVTAPVGDTVNIDSGHMPRNWLHMTQDGACIITNSHATKTFDVLVNATCLFAFTMPVPGSGLALDAMFSGMHQKARDLNPNRPFASGDTVPKIVRGYNGVRNALQGRKKPPLPPPKSHEVQHAPETDLEKHVQDVAAVGGVAMMAHQTGAVSKAKNLLGFGGANAEEAAEVIPEVTKTASWGSEILSGLVETGEFIEEAAPVAAAMI